MKHTRLAAVTLAASTIPLFAVVPGTVAAAPNTDCPAVYALGVQGTGQSSPDASPTTDTGMLSTVFTPLQAAAAAEGVSVEREYVPYESGFGGFTAGASKMPYDKSVTGGADKLRAEITDIAGRCADTRIGLVGYSQGSHVVSLVAQEIGQGRGPVPADHVVGVSLFGDPTRAPGASAFPGAGDKRSPDAVPGTSGQAVAAIDELVPTTAPGGGIGPRRDTAIDFGALTGRVASFCSAGDLACDAPDNAALLRTVANVAGTVQNPGDPLQALANIAESLAMTSIKTFTNVVNQDVQGNSLASLSINPKKSLSARLAEASDPRTPLDPAGAIQALFKVGTIALNAAITVVRTVLTPANVAEIATAGLANPAAGLATFGMKLLSALPQLIPPATGERLIMQTFNAIAANVTDNVDLLNVATWTKYSDVIQRHGSYTHDAATVSGKPATTWTADWFAAAAKDIAGGHHN